MYVVYTCTSLKHNQERHAHDSYNALETGFYSFYIADFTLHYIYFSATNTN